MSDRVLICGSQTWTDYAAIRDRIAQLPDDTIVIQGGAVGADRLAKWLAEDRGLWVIDVSVKFQHWKRFGKSAGHKRNHIMLDLAPSLVVAFQHGGSPGTQGTIDEARRRGIPVEVHSAPPVAADANEVVA